MNSPHELLRLNLLRLTVASALTLLLSAMPAIAAAAPKVGTLEVIAELPIRPGNVAAALVVDSQVLNETSFGCGVCGQLDFFVQCVHSGKDTAIRRGCHIAGANRQFSYHLQGAHLWRSGRNGRHGTQ